MSLSLRGLSPILTNTITSMGAYLYRMVFISAHRASRVWGSELAEICDKTSDMLPRRVAVFRVKVFSANMSF